MRRKSILEALKIPPDTVEWAERLMRSANRAVERRTHEVGSNRCGLVVSNGDCATLESRSTQER